jgi:deoxyribose-phosphate aldolase
MEMGADEIGVFINIGALKDKDYEYVKGEIDEIRYSIPGKTLKIIVETHKLEEEELIKIVEICNETFVNYLEIYNTKKHTEDSFKDLNIINKYKGEVLEIKVSGNIKHEDEILRLIEDGVSKVGISKISSLVKEDCMHKCEDCDCKEE